jgi:hypothetical protein
VAEESMMPEGTIADFLSRIEGELEELRGRLERSLDFAEVERTLTTRVNQVLTALLERVLRPVLSDARWLERLRRLGGRLGMRFKEYRRVRVRLSTGMEVEVVSPYFIKAAPKRGRRKRGPNGRGAPLGLEALGFVGRCSARRVSEVVQNAVLCPSLAVAREVLARRGIELDVKTPRRLCGQLGERGLALRGQVSLSGTERLAGQSIVIGMEGGRLRERRCKRGRKKAGHKRQGYHTDWREPKLFTIDLLDPQGEVVEAFAPLQDATLGDHEQLFALLECYLRALDLSQVARFVFCGDGAPWIWHGVQGLCQRLELDPESVHEVLDYTHAVQNLHEILDLVPAQHRTGQTLDKRWKALLWQGDIEGLRQAMTETLKGKKKTQALHKWQRYFAHPAQRMRYQQFRDQHLPCGSGHVESAIRRVINLRLKAPGTFWTRQMAECVLFLRAQLLSGRWDILLANLTGKTAQMMADQEPVEHFESATTLPMAA